MEFILGLWTIFDAEHSRDHISQHSIDNIIIRPKVSKNQWLRGGYLVNSLISSAIAPIAFVYTEGNLSLLFNSSNWVKIEKAYIAERFAANDPNVNKMTTSITFWALEKDQLVFERFKNAAKSSILGMGLGDVSPAGRKIGRKLTVLYIDTQGRGRSLTASSHSAILRVLTVELAEIIQAEIVKMEELSSHDQIHLSSRTDIIIGVHGNGLSSALWMQKGGAMIELFPANACFFDYSLISIVSRLSYTGLSGNISIPRFSKSNVSHANLFPLKVQMLIKYLTSTLLFSSILF